MIKGKTLRHTLDKFLKNSEVAKEEFLAPCTKMKNFMKALAACRLQLMACGLRLVARD
jgi:hypothetical protein